MIFILLSCDEHLDNPESGAYVSIYLDWDKDEAPETLTDVVITFRNNNTGAIKYFSYETQEMEISPGLYDITLNAIGRMKNGVKADVRALNQSVTIKSGENRIQLQPFVTIDSDDLIIAEIFFAGTLQSSGNQYYGDDYVKLYNNTDHVIYADGLTLFESKFLTTEKFDYTPDIMSEAMTVHALYTVPGSGHDHPVEPGEYFLLADTGIDHRVINPNSFSLAHADFEWFDVSTSPSNLDIDSPTVPNLDKWYCYTLSFWVLHNRGFKAYGLARIPIDQKQYLKDYWYTFDYTIVVPAGTFSMSQSAYKLPNAWLTDVVNCSVQAKYEWNICHPSLDMGWTYCGTIDHDKTRYFHSVRRKLAGLNQEGRPILQDTNNSTVDFNAFVIPSEIELQGTAIDIFGTPCTQITYDGVTPIINPSK